MEVRRIRADEGLAYREVRLRALRLAPDAYGSTYEEEVAYPDDAWVRQAERTADAMEAASFVVDRGDGTLAGTVFVAVSPEPPYDGYAGAMWVDDDLRGAGWADALLAAAERFAFGLGSRALHLWVEESNARARRFYERCGYLPTGVDEPSRGGGRTLLVRKDLPLY